MAFGPEINGLIEFLQKESDHFFTISTEFGGGNPGGDRRFSSIYNVRNLFHVWANYVERESFFNRYPQMTNHGIEHIENVVSIVAQMVLPFCRGTCTGVGVPDPDPDASSRTWLLNRSEVFCLAAAAFLHDIGMYITGDETSEDDPDYVRDNHGRLSMEKMFRERKFLFPGFSDAEIHLVGAIASYHQSKTPFDEKAKDQIIGRLRTEAEQKGKPFAEPVTQDKRLQDMVMVGVLMNAPMWGQLCREEFRDRTMEVSVLESGEVRLHGTEGEGRTIVSPNPGDDAWIKWCEWLNAHRDLGKSGSFPTLWKLRYSPPVNKKNREEEETVDPRFCAALLALADQCDNQVIRTGDLHFMIRQLDRARWRLGALRNEDSLIRTMAEKGRRFSAASAGRPPHPLKREMDSGRRRRETEFFRRKAEELKYLEDGYVHFLPNLAIQRVLLIPSKVRHAKRLQIQKKFEKNHESVGCVREEEIRKLELKPLSLKKLQIESLRRRLKAGGLKEEEVTRLNADLASLEEKLGKLSSSPLPTMEVIPAPRPNPKKVPGTQDQLLHIILKPNDFSILGKDLDDLKSRGMFRKEVDELEPYLKDYPRDLLVGAAGAYIAGELDRLRETLGKRGLSLRVFEFNETVDEEAFPESRRIFSSGLTHVSFEDCIFDRGHYSEWARKMAFPLGGSGVPHGSSPEDSPPVKCLWMYGPSGMGKTTTALGIARILLTGKTPLEVPSIPSTEGGGEASQGEIQRLKKEVARAEGYNRDIKGEFKGLAHRVMVFRFKDRDEMQLSDFIRQLSWFLSVNGEFALENMLRHLEEVTRNHADFAIECLQELNQNLVIILQDMNKVTQVNRWFFRKLVDSKNERIRIFATSTHNPAAGWLSLGMRKATVLRFSYHEFSQESQGKDAARIWKEACGEVAKTPHGKFSASELELLFQRWQRYGCFPVFFRFLFLLSKSCRADFSWLLNRIDSHMVDHLFDSTENVQPQQKDFLDFLTHFFFDQSSQPTAGEIGNAWKRKDWKGNLWDLQERGFVDFLGIGGNRIALHSEKTYEREKCGEPLPDPWLGLLADLRGFPGEGPTVDEACKMWGDSDYIGFLRLLEKEGFLEIRGFESNKVVLHPAFIRNPKGRDKAAIWPELIP